jgi:hypothetical protein
MKELNECYDGTQYWFELIGEMWYVCAYHIEDGNVVRVPWNKGKFLTYSGSYDYAKHTFWDWSNYPSNSERRRFRTAWIRDRQPRSIKEFREMYTAPCDATLGNSAPVGRPLNSIFDIISFSPAIQEGNNPMYHAKINAPQANAAVIATAGKSDDQLKREFLMEEFNNSYRYDWNLPKLGELRKLYNIDAPKAPRTSQEIIDAFKNGDIEIDQAKVDKQTKYFAAREDDDEDYDDLYESGISDRYFGITFTKLPKEDVQGFRKARAEYEALVQDTKRTIMVADPSDGLAALKALENWKPTKLDS